MQFNALEKEAKRVNNEHHECMHGQTSVRTLLVRSRERVKSRVTREPEKNTHLTVHKIRFFI